MSVRIIIYGPMGEAATTAAMTQIRALVGEMGLQGAQIQLVSDVSMMAANGVETPPAVAIDGSFLSNGWIPSRNEIKRALEQRLMQNGPQTPAGRPSLSEGRKKSY
jgi:hypothetical protein